MYVCVCGRGDHLGRKTHLIAELHYTKPYKIFSIILNGEIQHLKTDLPYKFYVLGQIGLSKQCRPRSDCF